MLMHLREVFKSFVYLDLLPRK